MANCKTLTGSVAKGLINYIFSWTWSFRRIYSEDGSAAFNTKKYRLRR